MCCRWCLLLFADCAGVACLFSVMVAWFSGWDYCGETIAWSGWLWFEFSV